MNRTYRILGSNGQVVSEYTGFTTWHGINLPMREGEQLALVPDSGDWDLWIVQGKPGLDELRRYYRESYDYPSVTIMLFDYDRTIPREVTY